MTIVSKGVCICIEIIILSLSFKIDCFIKSIVYQFDKNSQYTFFQDRLRTMIERMCCTAANITRILSASFPCGNCRYVKKGFVYINTPNISVSVLYQREIGSGFSVCDETHLDFFFIYYLVPNRIDNWSKYGDSKAANGKASGWIFTFEEHFSIECI